MNTQTATTAYTGRATFVRAFDSEHSIPVRSILEARWCVFLTAIGVPWTYEPQTFALDTGRLYTPDLRIETADGPALVEIKPSMDKLRESAHKLDALRRGLAQTPGAPMLVSFTASAPGFHWRGPAGPCVLRWDVRDADGVVRIMHRKESLRLFSCLDGRALAADNPDAYEDHVARMADRSAKDLRDRIGTLDECLFFVMLEDGVPFNEAVALWNERHKQ